MAQHNENRPIDGAVELLKTNGFDGLAEAVTVLLNSAMVAERSEHLGAAPYERSAQRVGYANGDWDLGIAIDVLEAAKDVDTGVLLSGDGDFDLLLKKTKRTMPSVPKSMAYRPSQPTRSLKPPMSIIVLMKIYCCNNDECAHYRKLDSLPVTPPLFSCR